MSTIVADGAAPIIIPCDKGLAGNCYTSRKLINIVDAYQDDRFNRSIDIKSGYRTKSVLCYPILNSKDEVIAVIQLINKLTGLQFTKADEDLIAAFCAQLAVSIENLRAIADLVESQKQADDERGRMRSFLGIVGELNSVPEIATVCELTQLHAQEFTRSLGAALLLCADDKALWEPSGAIAGLLHAADETIATVNDPHMLGVGIRSKVPVTAHRTTRRLTHQPPLLSTLPPTPSRPELVCRASADDVS